MMQHPFKNAQRITQFVGSILFAFLFCLSAHATTITEVTSPSGIKAWLVEDHKLPLIAMDFAFAGGVEQDPAALQGLANITMELLTEGAGGYDAAKFQQVLADHSIKLNFSAGRDALSGHVKMLSRESDRAFDLTRLALSQPRFDADDVERARAEQLSALRSQLGSPDWQARYALYQKIFAGHPYGQRRLGTTQTLAAITRDDIRAFASGHLAQDNLIVAVAGDITPEQLSNALDKIFSALPAHEKLTHIDEVTLPKGGAVILTPREGTQTAIHFAMPGPHRDDPEWYAAEIANYILGGGGFQSRLMQEVRDKKGLTYGIDTDLAPADHVGLILGNAATDNPKTAEAWSITLATMQKFYDVGVSDNDIAASKDYLTGSLALALTSTDKIASALVEMQRQHLGIDYLDRRNDLIRSVAADDVQQVIKRWFNPEALTVSMVGKPSGITPTETRPLVRE